MLRNNITRKDILFPRYPIKSLLEDCHIPMLEYCYEFGFCNGIVEEKMIDEQLPLRDSYQIIRLVQIYGGIYVREIPVFYEI